MTTSDKAIEEAEVNVLEYHATQITNRFTRFYKKALIAFAILGVTNTVALVGFGIVLDNQSDLSADIQQQRFDTLVQFCQDTNQRNAAVNKEINDAVLQQSDAEQKANAEGTAAFRLIINASVPYTENCTEEASNLVKGTQ